MALYLAVAPGLFDRCNNGLVIALESAREAYEFRGFRDCASGDPEPQSVCIPVFKDLPKLLSKLFCGSNGWMCGDDRFDPAFLIGAPVASP